jgi:hypothetical protein
MREDACRVDQCSLAAKKPQQPFETLADLIGCAEGGPPDLSENTGQRLRELLLQGRDRRLP